MTEDAASRPVVPGYDVREPVGLGAGGPVWSAVRTRDGRSVALKIVRADPQGPAGRAGHAGPTRDTVVGAGEPHVVPVLDVLPYGDDGGVVVVMPLMDGGSLRAAVGRRGRLSAGECVTVLVPVAGALGRLHRRGLVHGDLAPGNVLFDAEGRPHLSDLGASHAVGDLPREVYGTDGFVAPEVLLGAAPGPAADVYAVGALGWFCLTGEEPEVAQLRDRLADRLEALGLQDVPAALVRALEAALDPHPQDRPDPDALAEAVFASCPAEGLVVGRQGDPGSGLTRRLRAAMQEAAADDAGPGPGGGFRARWWPGRRRGAPARTRASRRMQGTRGPRAGRPVIGWLLAVTFLALVVTGAATVLANPAGRRTPASTAVSPAPGASSPAGASTGDILTAGAVPGPPPAPGSLTATDARRIVQELSDLRVTAWSDPAGADWTAWTVPDGPARAADLRDRQALVEAGERVRGLALAVTAADVVSTDAATVIVRVATTLSSHEVVAPDRTRAVPAAAGPVVDLELRRHQGAWRVWEVLVSR